MSIRELFFCNKNTASLMPTKININHEDLFAFSRMNAAHCIGA